MSVTGPIPERSENRIRRNKPDTPIEKITAIGLVEVPELGNIHYRGEIHQLVEDLWDGMTESAQAKYFEPSDWQFARLTLFALNQEIVSAQHANKPIGAMKLSALNQMMTQLLLTEGERRRVRIEVEREASGGGEVLSLEEAFKRKLTGSS